MPLGACHQSGFLRAWSRIIDRVGDVPLAQIPALFRLLVRQAALCNRASPASLRMSTRSELAISDGADYHL